MSRTCVLWGYIVSTRHNIAYHPMQCKQCKQWWNVYVQRYSFPGVEAKSNWHQIEAEESVSSKCYDNIHKQHTSLPVPIQMRMYSSERAALCSKVLHSHSRTRSYNHSSVPSNPQSRPTMSKRSGCALPTYPARDPLAKMANGGSLVQDDVKCFSDF